MTFLKPQSCCCFDLRTGALIMASLRLIFNFGSLVTSSVMFSYYDDYQGGRYTDVTHYVFAGFITDTLIHLFVSAFLFYGVVKGRHEFLLPWLVIHMISIVVSTVLFCSNCSWSLIFVSWYLRSSPSQVSCCLSRSVCLKFMDWVFWPLSWALLWLYCTSFSGVWFEPCSSKSKKEQCLDTPSLYLWESLCELSSVL